MKLVLVHGINQQGKSSALIEKQWLEALRAGAGADPVWPYSKVSTIDATESSSTPSMLRLPTRSATLNRSGLFLVEDLAFAIINFARRHAPF